MPVSSKPFAFSRDAVEFWDDLEDKIWQRIRELAKRRAESQQTFLIGISDIKATYSQAIAEVLAEVLAESNEDAAV